MRLRVTVPAAFLAAASAASAHAIEAETGAVSGATRVLSCGACSGGQRVGYIGRGSANSLTLTVSSSGGSQTMTMYCTINGTRRLYYSVNGVLIGSVQVSGTSFTAVAPPVSVPVTLSSGTNTIRFHNDSLDPAPDLDRVLFSGGGTAPTPTPTATATPGPGPTSTPTSTPTPTPGGSASNITPPGGSVTASMNDGNVPANTVDGSLSTRWSASGDGQWIQYDLGSPRGVSYVRLAAYNGNVRQSRFDLQVSTDGTSWSNVLTNALTSGTTTQLETHEFADVSARFVRYLGHMNTVNTFNSLTEVQIWGGGTSPIPTPTPTPTSLGPTPTPTATPSPTPTPTSGSTNVVPLYSSGTALEPALVVDTGSALITRLADRARDRHAREAQFQNYDHYLPLYWVTRTIGIEIIDRVAKGGSDITVNVTSLHPLETPDFRAFYQGQTVLSQYWFNVDMTELDPLHYTATVNYNMKMNRPIQIGDRMEIEISPFMRQPVEGRANYYGTAMLYVVGQGGMVPWEGIGGNLDSFALPQAAWLGGRTTLPYPYSNEPQHRFKQIATNLAPVSAQPFMDGRRLHHTDFGDGTHSEPGNPVFTAQRGKLGPRYIARSCIGCHTNNGRALPPGSGTAGFNVQFYVNNAPWADLHYNINGGGPQSFRMAYDAGSNTNTHIVRDIPGGASVTYHFTIGNTSGGLTTTPPSTFTMGAGGSGGNSSYGYFVLSPAMRYVVKVGQVSGSTVTPHPQLGSVLQPQSTSGAAEGGVSIGSWTTTSGTFGDGSGYSLRRPNYSFSGPVPSNYSARIAAQLNGLGLLEAIAESTVAGLADPNDSNGDGISGRMQTLTDPQTGQLRLGRFGWKAGRARLSHQIASALNFDMGITTSIFPTPDCGSAQTGCTSSTELSAADLDRMVRYIAVLGVPARRDLGNTQAQQGEALFQSAGCVKCHTPSMTTSAFHPNAELRSQTIRPFTDLLLHDMGPGLADNLPEANAAGAEWRTPPLWGIGLTAGVSGGEAYLHDGRARSLSEAILWHGGEAESAKEAFRTMSSANRAALIRFLQSL
jgi:CxxC motif-containing protein (DUF1111 family)